MKIREPRINGLNELFAIIVSRLLVQEDLVHLVRTVLPAAVAATPVMAVATLQTPRWKNASCVLPGRFASQAPSIRKYVLTVTTASKTHRLQLRAITAPSTTGQVGCFVSGCIASCQGVCVCLGGTGPESCQYCWPGWYCPDRGMAYPKGKCAPGW